MEVKSWTGTSSNVSTVQQCDADVSIEARWTPLGWGLIEDGVLLDVLDACPADMRWRDDNNPAWGGAWWWQDAAGKWHKTGETATSAHATELFHLFGWTLEV